MEPFHSLISVACIVYNIFSLNAIVFLHFLSFYESASKKFSFYETFFYIFYWFYRRISFYNFLHVFIGTRKKLVFSNGFPAYACIFSYLCISRFCKVEHHFSTTNKSNKINIKQCFLTPKDGLRQSRFHALMLRIRGSIILARKALQAIKLVVSNKL